jgi:MHS family proline/betaine transporter-like MFS transporter
LLSMYGGPVISVLAELFPTRVRSTAVGVVYNLVPAIAGFAPVVVTWLIAATGDPRAPAFFVIAAALISGTALFWLRDRYRERLQ